MINVPMPNSIRANWVCPKCESTWAWYMGRCAYCDPPKMRIETVYSESRYPKTYGRKNAREL